MKSRLCVVAGCALLLALSLPAVAQWGEGAAGPRAKNALSDQNPEPGLTYGSPADLPLPKTVVFTASPDEILEEAEGWVHGGVNAFFVYPVVREWSHDIWAVDGKPWTIGESDEMLQKTRRANELCRALDADTFLKVAFDHPFEWFNDVAWQRIENNFRQLAIFSRDSGCTGLTLDIEYINEQYSFDWEGYDYIGYTREDLVRKVRARMTDVIAACYDEWPEMVLLTFPECGLSLGGHIHAAWLEEAARRDAPGGIHYCTESTYICPNIRYVFAYAWRAHALFNRFLSKQAWDYWTNRCSVCLGVWPIGSDEYKGPTPQLSQDEFRQNLAGSLMASARYNWLYSSRFHDELYGRNLDQYDGPADLPAYHRIMAARQMATNPKYVAIAKDLRAMKLRDYSDDLGLVIEPTFRGPDDVPRVDVVPVSSSTKRERAALWETALDIAWGKEINLREQYGTQTRWMILGPFPNEGAAFQGYNTVYPPEKGIDLDAEYEGVNQMAVRWTEHHRDDGHASVDLKAVLAPSDWMCAYALCYVTAPQETTAQIRHRHERRRKDVGRRRPGIREPLRIGRVPRQMARARHVAERHHAHPDQGLQRRTGLGVRIPHHG